MLRAISRSLDTLLHPVFTKRTGLGLNLLCCDNVYLSKPLDFSI